MDGEGPFHSNAIEFHKNNSQTMQNNGWIHLIKEDLSVCVVCNKVIKLYFDAKRPYTKRVL